MKQLMAQEWKVNITLPIETTAKEPIIEIGVELQGLNEGDEVEEMQIDWKPVRRKDAAKIITQHGDNQQYTHQIALHNWQRRRWCKPNQEEERCLFSEHQHESGTIRLKQGSHYGEILNFKQGYS
ncbi:hypothetical protein HAX54_019865 [Datura stramonium]|uniref:Uncharacterized protein n=1 Tax=Datura stramonium TaxID=4076 RepID=A0ABS8Y8M9_DATST|nr:hypothetical protein [Datura stramonium]